MVKLYLDTLVFGLQKMGGVSVVWYEYIKRLLEDSRVDLTLLDIPQDYVNFAYQNLDTSLVKHEKEKNLSLQLLRNTNPVFCIPKEIAIFQSTYLRTCKRKNIKNVVMIHDVTHQLYFSGIKKWLNTFQKKRSIKNADGIICVSENTLNDLHRLFPESKKLKSAVVYNSASEDYKRLANAIIPERYQELVNKKYIIYVGDRFPYKNTNFLIEVIEKTGYECVLIGGSDFSPEEIARMGENIHKFHHFTKVPNEELNILYNKAHCMIYPSLYEGFGIPVLEAMKTGCPVIAFNNSSIPEVLRGSGFLLENNDISGALKALKIIEDNKEREKMSKKEIEAADFFNWDESYSRLIDFYETICRE